MTALLPSATGSGPQGATQSSRTSPGTATTVQNRKNCVYPTASTRNPVVALANVRGTPASDVSSASWVAVYRTSVLRAMNATNAAVPSPTPRYSKLTTKNSAVGSAPISAKAAKPRMESSCRLSIQRVT